MVEAQDLAIYACTCGFTDPDKKTFDKHLLTGARKDGKGIHKSKGRVNATTGDIVMPPFNQRTKEQKDASIYALKKKGTQDASGAIRQTEILMDANQIKFVPRVLTCSFTPIMQAAWTAAQRVWGFRPDMPWENFLDTMLVHAFSDRGIKLTSFVIENPEVHDNVRQQNVEIRAKETKKEEVAP
jgi:hypothetical protein